MKIIIRKGSEVLIQDKQGRYWVTKRKKLHHDSRRQRNKKGCRVVYIPLYRIANPFFYTPNEDKNDGSRIEKLYP